MKETFLHFIWEKGLLKRPFYTLEGELVEILDPGKLNSNDGPDFTQAKIRLADKIWAGSVEIHLKSSDWKEHGHELSGRYKNLILHVVYKHDTIQIQLKEHRIPTLEINELIPKNYIDNFTLFQKSSQYSIPCSPFINDFTDKYFIRNWLEILYKERFIHKTDSLKEMLVHFENNWEKVCFIILSRAFGNHTNSQIMMEWAEKIPIEIIRKYAHDVEQLEALFFGMAGFLEEQNEKDDYSNKLKQTFDYQKSLHSLVPLPNTTFKWKGVRPKNFPTIRLAQLAALYHQYQNIFSSIVDAKEVKSLKNIFRNATTSSYWQENYNFGKPEKKSTDRKLSDEFIDKILINALIPLRYAWQQNPSKDTEIKDLYWIKALKAEKNTTVAAYKQIGFPVENAIHSQALLQLKKYYCDPKKCLNCTVGQKILMV